MNGTWTVQGSGWNIWGAEDQFHFASRAATGDVTLVARVTNLAATHVWAKAGLMIRNGSGASAAFAGVFVTPEKGVVFQWRSRNRAAPQEVTVPIGSAPVWLKLVRRGSSFAAYVSPNGKTWTRVGGPQTIAMPSATAVGLAVTSHDVTRRATATFTDVSVAD